MPDLSDHTYEVANQLLKQFAGDANLINLSAQLLQQAIDQLDFEPEQEPEPPTEEPANVD